MTSHKFLPKLSSIEFSLTVCDQALLSIMSLGLTLGATLNMGAAVVHVIRNLDDNTITMNICITGVVGIIVSIMNLVSVD